MRPPDRVHVGEDDQVLRDRQRAGEVDVAGGEVHPAERLEAAVAQVLAEQVHRAPVGRDQPEEHVQCGGLAGAVRTEEADDLSLADLEADLVDSRDGAEALDQPART
jgi:hypothetical protein